jgi:O-antigen/teichoic acid export membrane protein
MSLAGAVYHRSNVVFLERTAGAADVGIYSAAWLAVDAATACGLLVVGPVLFPVLAGLWKSDRVVFARWLRDAARWLLAGSGVASFLLWAEADRIIGLVYGASYGESVWILRYLSPLLVLTLMHNLAICAAVSMGHERRMALFHLAAVGLNLAACLAAIPSAPLPGAVAAIVVTKAGVCALTFGSVFARREFLPARAFLAAGAAALTGALLYAGARGSLPREVAEALAVAPTLAMMLCWRRAVRPARPAAAAPPADGPR